MSTSTSTSTSTLDSLVAEFQQSLDRIEASSLQQWQFAYKQVIFKMGFKILGLFPLNALGPVPIAEPAGGSSGPSPPGPKGHGPFAAGGGPGGGPIIHVAIGALDLTPPP